MQTIRRFCFALAAFASSACSTRHVQASTIPPEPMPVPVTRDHREPQIDLWLSGGSVVRRGESLRATYRTTEDGYVTIARIDTDGRISVLFPRTPYDDNWVEGGRTYHLHGHDGGTFYADNHPGLGYVFGIVSSRRLELRRYARASSWDYDALGGDVYGDPYPAMREFAEQLLYHQNDPYSLDYESYSVDRSYSYPRYLCRECSRGRRYPVWDAYDHLCPHYRVVVYDDPDYYPYRRDGRHVVYSRPRYEFKPVRAGEPAPTTATAIEYRRRSDMVDRRRPGSPAADPNLPAPNDGERGGGSPGGTRPGDDQGGGADDPRRPGRRRGHEADGPGNSNNAPGRVNRPQRENPPGQGSGGGNNGNGNGNGDGQGQGSGQGNGQGQGNDPSNGNGNGNGGSQGNGGQNPNGNGANGGSNGGYGSRRPPQAPPVTGSERPRDEPRAERPRDEPGAERPRDEPRAERRRDEPRSQPRSEPRSQPRAEPRRTAEAKSEPSRTSAPVRSRPRSP